MAMLQASLDIALNHYITFLDKYSTSHNYDGKSYKHSIPSSFAYSLIRDNCIWLFNLIVGIAGYSIYFDNDTEVSKIVSLDLLNQAGIKDPVLSYKSSIEPWTGLTSVGKSPTAPVDGLVTGLGIAHFNKGGLEAFYTGEKLTAVLPEIDSDNKIVRVDGVMQTKTYSITYNGKIVRGWGMSYGDKKLSLDVVCPNTSNLCYTLSDSLSILKGKPSEYKLIGTSGQLGKRENGNLYMTKAEAQQFVNWSKVHFSNSFDRLFPAADWMCKYWAPFFSWHNGTQENTIQATMLLSSIANSMGKKMFLNGKSQEYIIDWFISHGNSQKEKEHFQRRIVNTQRAITFLEFVKRI